MRAGVTSPTPRWKGSPNRLFSRRRPGFASLQSGHCRPVEGLEVFLVAQKRNPFEHVLHEDLQVDQVASVFPAGASGALSN